MARVIDLSESDGDFVVIGRSIVLPSSEFDSQPAPLNGALRFQPSIGKAQLFFNGAWVTLGEGSGGSEGDGSSSNHTHTMSQILGLSAALATKASLVHTHTISDITGLTTQLAGKAATVHNHGISDIVNLQQNLDGKASINHTHSLTLKEKISACFPGNPPSLFRLVWTATEALTFPVGLTASKVSAGTGPLAPYVITIYKNISTNVGNITINPNGTVIFNVGTQFVVAAGDTLTFTLPPRDVAIDTISMSIVGTKASLTIT